MRYADADFEPEADEVQALLQASTLLAERGVYALVWLDQNIVVRRRYGHLADFIAVDAPLANSVLPVVGLEKEIQALKPCEGGVLRLPNVATITKDGPGPRLNLLFYALPAETPFMLVVAPAPTAANLEVELARQVRARMIAEAEVAAKSQALSRANTELTVANANLEQFASIVSHDLKAPMRALRYLVDDIETAIGPFGGNGTAAIKLQELRRQTGRLTSMLSTLLHYVTTGADSVETVDTRKLMTEILRSLPQTGIKIELAGAWPSVRTLVAPLDTTLRNLTENAIKHHNGESGRVVVCCIEAGDTLEISVADDGPGIDPEHQQSIFMPFRALGGDGGGMGLAIVQKMVAAAGGSISVESEPAQRRGTIFRVKWPKTIAL
jgi:signal transduction histidine kinase